MSDELQKTRQSLLLRLKRHDGAAWREFVSLYEEAVFRYCRGRGLQEADARDATQEVLAAAHSRLESWDADDSRGTLRAWLFRVARNVAVDSIRRRARQAQASGDTRIVQLLSEIPESEASALDWEYRRAAFQWAAEQVKPEVRDATWRAFWLTAIDGKSAEYASEELQVSVGAVYTAKCRVVARIRAKLAEVSDPDIDFPATTAQET